MKATGLDLQIGEKVTWTVGRVVSKGCYLEDTKNGMSTVITHFIGGVPCNREVEVVKSILKLDI